MIQALINLIVKRELLKISTNCRENQFVDIIINTYFDGYDDEIKFRK